MVGVMDIYISTDNYDLRFASCNYCLHDSTAKVACASSDGDDEGNLESVELTQTELGDLVKSRY